MGQPKMQAWGLLFAVDPEIQRIEEILAGNVPTNVETVETMKRFLAALAEMLAEEEGLTWWKRTFQANIEILLGDAGRHDLAGALVQWTIDRYGWTARNRVKNKPAQHRPRLPAQRLLPG